MRVGFHPLKKKGSLEAPKDVTVQMVTFVPFLSGYFEQSLDVLKLSLQSLWQNTELPYDLMIFDNGSCDEVRGYLLDQHRQHKIQYLFLSDENVGLPGAWNTLFRAAPGKIIAYSDSDVYYYPGWLSESLRVIETYPKVGMVTGCPVRTLPHLYSAGVNWANQSGATVQRGKLQEWETFWTHSRSLGMSEQEARENFDQGEDLLVEYQGVRAYIGASHFQFVSPRDALNAAAPFPYIMAMGNELYLDEHINQMGYLRLELPEIFVRHIGNRASTFDAPGAGVEIPQAMPPKKDQSQARRLLYQILDIRLLRRALLYLHNMIFRLYYDREDKKR